MGPRPESVSYVRELEKELPVHSVQPRVRVGLGNVSLWGYCGRFLEEAGI